MSKSKKETRGNTRMHPAARTCPARSAPSGPQAPTPTPGRTGPVGAASVDADPRVLFQSSGFGQVASPAVLRRVWAAGSQPARAAAPTPPRTCSEQYWCAPQPDQLPPTNQPTSHKQPTNRSLTATTKRAAPGQRSAAATACQAQRGQHQHRRQPCVQRCARWAGCGPPAGNRPGSPWGRCTCVVMGGGFRVALLSNA